MIHISEGRMSEEFGPQLPTKEKTVSMFKDKNISEKEAIETYTIWLADKQRQCDESLSLYSRLIFNIEVAELLLDANLLDDARDYIDGAWNVIEFEGVDGMYEFDNEEEWGPLREKLVQLSIRLDQEL